MLFGPVLTAWLSHLERKHLFVAILLVLAGSNALAALAPNLWVLALARFIPALALPVFWGTASETAGQLAGPARSGRAVLMVYLGISAALLFGIPLGSTAAFCALLALGMASSMLLAGTWSLLCIALAVWGIANTALYPICQIRVMKAASHAQALAGTLNVSAANAGIGLGAVIGGLAIPTLGRSSVGYVAAAIALCAVAAAVLVTRMATRPA